MLESNMEFVMAQDNEEIFAGFQKLENEFDQHYTELGVGVQYDRDISAYDDRAEFEDYMKEGNFFMLAKIGDEYVGYVAGMIIDTPRGYNMKKIGFLDSLITLKKYRAQGIGKQLCDKFFEWLKSKDITVCQLEVKSENIDAIALYEKWGFKTDQVRMWSKIV